MDSIKTLHVDHLVGLEVGTSVLLSEIGRGSMGIIFTAYQRTLKRQIAVKILPKALLTSRGAEMFRNEAESAAILSHPNIVTIHEVGETEDFLFLTMQFVKGRAVSEYIKMARRKMVPSKRFLPLKTTIEIVTSVLDALDYAHRQYIVHRDIKPANVIIESHTKRPIITDFGLAKVFRGLGQGSLSAAACASATARLTSPSIPLRSAESIPSDPSFRAKLSMGHRRFHSSLSSAVRYPVSCIPSACGRVR